MTNETAGAGERAFPDLALDAFRFLTAAGFSVARYEDKFIRLESDHLYVNIYHGRSSYEVGLELGRLNRVELYSLYEVMSAFAPADANLARLQAVEPSAVVRSLRRVAGALERQCRDLFAADDTAFMTLQSTATRLRESATIAAQYGAIVDQGDRAWSDGDRSSAADLYESAGPALDEVRLRRLAYVRRRQAGR